MLNENKSDRNVERRVTIEMTRKIKISNKEFNERFSLYLLISNIADRTKGISIGYKYKCLSCLNITFAYNKWRDRGIIFIHIFTSIL